METVKVTHTTHSLKFQQFGDGCLGTNDTNALLAYLPEAASKTTCAIECVRLPGCVSWDWTTDSVDVQRECRLLNRTPDRQEITANATECLTYRLLSVSNSFNP